MHARVAMGDCPAACGEPLRQHAAWTDVPPYFKILEVPRGCKLSGGLAASTHFGSWPNTDIQRGAIKAEE